MPHMKRNTSSFFAAAALFAGSVLILPAQETPAAAPSPSDPDAETQSATAPAPPPTPPQSSNAGWRRVDSERTRSYRDENGEPVGAAAARANTPPPSQLILPAGSWIKARVDQPLSSDRNLPGDTFTATLVAPLVVDGFVVARRGQTIEGRVSEARKAGRSKGTSMLGVEVTHLSLVDGRQMPVRSQLMEYAGGASVGRDVAAAATVTGTGAAIGAAAAGGVGAGIGALAGAAASAIGVLSTRGRATEIYPEAEIRFRTLEPITISTDRSAQAFLAVRQDDYQPVTLQQRVTVRQSAPLFYGGGFYGGGWDPFWGGGYWGRPYWGPTFGFYSYRGWGGGGGFYRGGGGGFRRGRR